MTLKLEAHFVLDNHHLPERCFHTSWVFFSSTGKTNKQTETTTKNVSITHLVSLHPLRRSYSEQAENVFQREVFIEELLHTPTHAHVNSPFLSTQTVAGSEVGEDACSSDSQLPAVRW